MAAGETRVPAVRREWGGQQEGCCRELLPPHPRSPKCAPHPWSWAALPRQITVFMPAINPPQGAGRGFGQPWCHRLSHQLLGMGGGSRAAAQRVWGAARVPQNQSTLKLECPLALGWCHPCVLATLFGAQGIGAGVPVGRGGRGAGTVRGTFVPWSRGLGGQGAVCQLWAPQLVSLQQGRWRQSAQRCPHPPWLPRGPAGAPCRARVSFPAWQHRCLHPAFRQLPLPGGETARPAPSGCWGCRIWLFSL